ncbi:conserved hypothetical protein [Hyella patelloides LEGE 07179]|uniref:Uncharacterized protein n=1 Tax=Hyella patelloides LEGE 07179 TaxID=945734 RepID=A0A563VYQ8_9CYAN|nr:hypothetical protein [Hyella patelloides]VEP16559.1 conserved hypothetical protein [Hyella patelloides LEGE 07179]
MKVRWKILLTSMTMWLIGEFVLNLVGLDEFADYSEFLQDKIRLNGNSLNLSLSSEFCG